ncbi:MAG: DNA alkylation repair protein [Flavobacteriales bacterium]|nr:DNA alkylation repair protein [Flavobacteriales bacterium]
MEPLKYMFTPNVVKAISVAVKEYYPSFDATGFEKSVLDDTWSDLELKARIAHITQNLRRFMSNNVPEALKVIEKVSKALPSGFEQITLPTFVEFYGLEHFEDSMRTMKSITAGSTCEFAIRQFLKAQPTKTLAIMKKWTSDKNEHVRRLASEGCRPRLPWGGNFQLAIENPNPIVEILELLRADESLYVRKSVANNLNDISKDHPELVLEIAERWLEEDNKHTTWIVKKALRSLLKNAHPRALELFGYGNPNQVLIEALKLIKHDVKIGGKLHFKFECINNSIRSEKIRLEYLITYVNKTGQATKVFQISEMEMVAKESRTFKKYQSFADMSTRKHHPGEHKLAIRINGVIKSEVNFTVIK